MICDSYHDDQFNLFLQSRVSLCLPPCIRHLACLCVRLFLFSITYYSLLCSDVICPLIFAFRVQISPFILGFFDVWEEGDSHCERDGQADELFWIGTNTPIRRASAWRVGNKVNFSQIFLGLSTSNIPGILKLTNHLLADFHFLP